MPTINETGMGRLAKVHPRLSDLIQQLAAQMSEEIGVTQGLRSFNEQDALYAQGREDLDAVNTLRTALNWAAITEAENIRVTNARGGFSWHNFGLAVDVVPFASASQPDWNVRHPVWLELVDKGEALGLTSGISWGDEPHFQLQGRFPIDEPTDEVRSIFATDGLQGVWQQV